MRKVEIAEKMLNCSNFLVDCQHGALVEAVVSLDFWGEGGAWVSHGPVALAAPLPPGLVFTEPRWLDGEASGERPPAGYRARGPLETLLGERIPPREGNTCSTAPSPDKEENSLAPEPCWAFPEKF